MIDAMTQLVAVVGRGVVPTDDPFITASDLGLTRGDGCFDAMRVVKDATGVRVDHRTKHLARFARSCKALGLSMEPAVWQNLIDAALDTWKPEGEAILKLVATRGPEIRPGNPTGFLTITSVGQDILADRAGMTVETLARGYDTELFAGVPWLLGGVKTLSYAINVAATRHAIDQGFRDALFVSSDGFALEGPTSALMWYADDTLWTTRTGTTGILSSVTVETIFKAAVAAEIPTGSGLIRPEDLNQAWVVSAIRGVCPITKLDERILEVDPDLTARISALAGF